MRQPKRDTGGFAPGEAHGETDERLGRDSGGLSLAESHAGQPRRDSGGSAPGEAHGETDEREFNIFLYN